jgi:hypothetical protein
MAAPKEKIDPIVAAFDSAATDPVVAAFDAAATPAPEEEAPTRWYSGPIGAAKGFAGGIVGIASMAVGGTDPATERVMRMSQRNGVKPRPREAIQADAQNTAQVRGEMMAPFEPSNKAEQIGSYVGLAAEILIPFSTSKIRAALRLGKGTKAAELIEEMTKRGIKLSDEQIGAIRTGQKPKLTAEQVKALGEAPAPKPPSAAATQADEMAQAVSGSSAAGQGGGAAAGELGKYATNTGVNLNRLNVTDEAKRLIDDVGSQIPERKVGPSVTFDEIKAREAPIITKPVTREGTVEYSAAVLRTRENFASLASELKVTPEYLRAHEVVDSLAAETGRGLRAFGINADAVRATPKYIMVKNLKKAGRTDDEILKAFDGVDWDDSRSILRAYNKVMAPRNGKEWVGHMSRVIDEYRFGNILSSFTTHEVNFASTGLNVAMRPVVYLGSGMFDPIASALTGSQRKYFMAQAPAFVRGAIANYRSAWKTAVDRVKGITPVEHLDLSRHIPTDSVISAPQRAVSRILDANDVFFRELAFGGETNAAIVRAQKLGESLNDVKRVEIAKDAYQNALELVFRKPLDPTNASGHGWVLSEIDDITAKLIMPLQSNKYTKWFVPFVRTPANIAKMGLEFSPGGFITMPGSTRKVEQFTKATIGSMVFMGSGAMALDGRTSWAMPKGKKEREAFRAAGREPYSVRIGDKWVSFTKLGPLAFPMALAAAMKHYGMDDPRTAGKGNMEIAATILSGWAEFFGDQSYVQSIGDMMDVVDGGGSVPHRFANAVGGVGRQLVPLSSLLGWVNQLMDPVYRETRSSDMVENAINKITSRIPGLAQEFEPMRDSRNVPVERPLPLVNAISPFRVSPVNEAEEARYQQDQQRRRIEALRRALREGQR